MTKTDFSRHLKSIETDGYIDRAKCAALPDEIKAAMAHHIIRNRGPVIEDLIPPNFARDMGENWLASMGYLHRSPGGDEARGVLWFIHTGEHNIIFKRIAKNDFQI